MRWKDLPILEKDEFRIVWASGGKIDTPYVRSSRRKGVVDIDGRIHLFHSLSTQEDRYLIFECSDEEIASILSKWRTVRRRNKDPYAMNWYFPLPVTNKRSDTMETMDMVAMIKQIMKPKDPVAQCTPDTLF